jgi:hypothetical protein
MMVHAKMEEQHHRQDSHLFRVILAAGVGRLEVIAPQLLLLLLLLL